MTEIEDIKHSENTNKSQKPKEKDVANVFAILTSEFLFIVLPFIVIAIIKTHQGTFTSIVFMPEWSLSSAILCGQSIVKFVSGVAAYHKSSYWQRVALAVTLPIVFGIAPSLILLGLIITSETPALWLGVSQIIMFVLGTVMFYLWGFVGGLVMEEKSE